MTEKQIREKIKLKIGSRDESVIWANVTGQGFVGKLMNPKEFYNSGVAILSGARHLSFGLGAKPGKNRGGKYPDYVGFEKITITPEMVGKTLATFLAIEAKRPGQKPTKEQQDRIDFLKNSGCCAGWADSDDGALKIITDFRETLEK